MQEEKEEAKNKAPEEDEIEVTLLGRGRGESCVIHYGGGKWLIVDSFFEPQEGKLPAARKYLDSIGVTADQVKAVVVTHLHADHYEGIAELHDYYSSAQLQYPAALKAKHYTQLFSGNPEAVFGDLPGAFTRASFRKLPGMLHGCRGLEMTKSVFYEAPDYKGTALAPTDGAVDAANRELGQVLQGLDSGVAEEFIKDDNRTCVVIHFTFNDFGVLLTSDMICSPAQFGWSAILAEPAHADLAPCDLIKVPHHGSEKSHSEEMWDRLVADSPVMLVTPFWPSQLPREPDIERLLRISPHLWLASPSTRNPPAGPSLGFPERIRIIEASLPKTGRLTARRRIDGGTWKIVKAPPAFKCSGVAM